MLTNPFFATAPARSTSISGVLARPPDCGSIGFSYMMRLIYSWFTILAYPYLSYLVWRLPASVGVAQPPHILEF